MGKGRLEAFSDGVIAIIITIMVLELRAPEEPTLAALRPLIPVFGAYALSFLLVAIYWNNHHHMLHVARSVTGPILWANMHLLFWLSLFPFATAWIGDTEVATVPVALYGAVLIMAAVAYTILATLLVRHEGPDSTLARAFGSDIKGKVSIALYALGIALAFVRPWLGLVPYVAVALLWLVPDRRIERQLERG
jgi:uncharacterized membrane protein